MAVLKEVDEKMLLELKVCDRCGAVVFYDWLHESWHDEQIRQHRLR